MSFTRRLMKVFHSYRFHVHRLTAGDCIEPTYCDCCEICWEHTWWVVDEVCSIVFKRRILLSINKSTNNILFGNKAKAVLNCKQNTFFDINILWFVYILIVELLLPYLHVNMTFFFVFFCFGDFVIIWGKSENILGRRNLSLWTWTLL